MVRGILYMYLNELLSSAGWFGTSGKIRVRFIHPYTDFVFASLTYYYRIFVFANPCINSFLFVVRIVVISYNINDHYGKLLLVGM